MSKLKSSPSAILILYIVTLLAGCSASQKEVSSGLSLFEKGNQSNDNITKLAYYTKALKDKALSNTQRAEIFIQRGITYRSMEESNKAYGDFNEALTLHPKNPKALCNRGFLYLDYQDIAKALPDFNRAINLDPKFSEAYIGRSNTLLEFFQFDLAIMAGSTAVNLAPNDARAYYSRGVAYLLKSLIEQANLYNEAIEDLTKSIKLNPNNPKAYDYRAQAYMRIGCRFFNFNLLKISA